MPSSPPHNLILALDQGTTSSRAILFDESGQPRATAQREVRQIYPQPGWVEHDPADIWTTQLATITEVLQKAEAAVHDLAAIGITNQRETTLLWERATGHPIHNAIVWQDRRTADLCDSLKKAGHAPTIQQKTGLVIDAYFSASKLQWLLDHIPHARTRAARGELAFGTVDSWLLWNLTRGPTKPGLHFTDISNASRTMLLNIHTGQWDPELLQLFNIPREILPEICDSSGLIAESHPSLLGRAIPIAGIAGDQQAALFGQACYSHGLAKNTYGTGCFMLMNIGQKPLPSKNQLLTTIAWRLANQTAITYALEGSVFIGGAVVQWLRDGLGIVKSAADVEQLARSVPDNGGIYLVPAFAGLGAPHWDQFARGIIAGITRGTSAGHIARAALEAIAFQVADILEVMHADSGIPIRQLRVDGGATANNLLMQFQADLLQVPVIRPTVTETTALGAAMLAGLGVGLWKDPAEVARRWQIEREFLPQMKPEEVAHRRARWNSALARARDWEQPA